MQVDNTQVELRACHSYDRGTVTRVVRECLSRLPAVQAGLRPGAAVLLKPNLINAKPPETAVCTHPEVVRAVAEMACEAGCEVLIADEPGYALTSSPEVLFGAAGIAEACAGLPVTFDLLKHGGYREVQVPRPLQLERVRMACRALDADLVINLPKCKTHQQTLLTGAIKNMFGALAPRERIDVHSLALATALSEGIADVFSTCVPHVNLMDAVVVMEGKGPSQGTPRFVGAILASQDAVALDALTEGMMGFAPGEVRVTTAAAEKGLGVCDLAAIAVHGESPHRFRVNLRRAPGGIRRGFPRWLGALARRMVWVRPTVLPRKCVRCGACAAVCPGEAITIADHAVINRSRCIHCFCCQEVCPAGAIDTQQSWAAARIIGRR